MSLRYFRRLLQTTGPEQLREHEVDYILEAERSEYVDGRQCSTETL